MSPAANRRRAEGRIRQLCCLGLGGEMIMPTLLREMHALIPSFSNCFFWADADGQISNTYDENPESERLGPLYLERYYNDRECEIHQGFTNAVRSRRGTVRTEQFFTVNRRAVLRSEMYNELLRPLGYACILQLFLREGGRTLGTLQMQRQRRERDFSDVDAQRLQRLMPFVAHALADSRIRDETDMLESGESGMLICSRDGRIVSTSPRARTLLRLASQNGANAWSGWHASESLQRAIAGICHGLDAIFTSTVNGPPPVLKVRNNWGQFTLRAYWLSDDMPGDGHIGVSVSRQVPLMLRLCQGLHALPLSPRQAEVAVLLAAGYTHQQIATHLGITRNTVIAHSRWLHNKLDVHDNLSLRTTLLQAGQVQASRPH